MEYECRYMWEETFLETVTILAKEKNEEDMKHIESTIFGVH